MEDSSSKKRKKEKKKKEYHLNRHNHKNVLTLLLGKYINFIYIGCVKIKHRIMIYDQNIYNKIINLF